VLAEIADLADRGVDVSPERLKIDGRAHLILPYHQALDGAVEASLGSGAIGTTGRGIGPAYADKASRANLRALDLRRPVSDLAARVRSAVQAKNVLLSQIYGQSPLEVAAVVEEVVSQARRLAPHVVDGIQLVQEALQRGQRILAEGAQGFLLDLTFGTYPYVTSSHPGIGGVLTGLGVGPNAIERVVGVMKAYQTRVGAGPMPTEAVGDLAERLRGTGDQPWDEFGTTTGRPRRCGWLDGVSVRHAVRLNGISEIVITKLDVLSGLDELRVATAYELKGQRIECFPMDTDALEHCQPVYHVLPGWKVDIMNITQPEDLPEAARRYVGFVERLAGVPVRLISVGPGRAQTIRR
jgi:adenylosuccinate synthase